MAYVQTNRRIAITTPLGKDVLLLRGFTGAEAISQLFSFDLDLLSENNSLKFDDVVGKSVTLRIFDANGRERYWDGIISRFSQGSRDRRLTAYRAQMVPWLWFLTRTADCRIFQNKKVPEIIQKVLEDLSFHDYELRLYGDFAPRDYCVQYRETDLNFISRLMEEEGIYYFSRHEQGKHVLILANDPAAHDPCPNQANARYDFRGGNITYEDVVTEWFHEQEFRTGTWTQTDYNFETPSTNLAVTVKGDNPYEIYDFPGEHQVRADGDRLARIRLQEQTAACVVSRGSGGCRYFGSGFKFNLTDHYRTDLNQAYLLTSMQHKATQAGDYNVGGGGQDELTYQNQFQCAPFSVPFRAARVTPRPFVQGCQTAVVVGPSGEEIYTDKHGRVKVQFYWDREGKRNESSSCWIRVSHPWAGKGWGAVSIPRIGQEVIVDFLEGNPDQPIITGRVYNAEAMPPNGLPAAGMVSGIKSNSTPGGGGYNELSMNDTKGKEVMTLHAQYDMDTTVEHDQSTTVHNNRRSSVDVDDTESVGSNQKISIGSNQTLTVGSNQNNSIGTSRTTTVGSNDGENVGGAQTLTVSASRTTKIGANDIESVGGDQSLTIGGSQKRSIAASDSLEVGSAKTVAAGGAVEISSGTSIKLTVGGSTITIGPSGIDISSGAIITLQASLIKNNS